MATQADGGILNRPDVCKIDDLLQVRCQLHASTHDFHINNLTLSLTQKPTKPQELHVATSAMSLYLFPAAQPKTSVHDESFLRGGTSHSFRTGTVHAVGKNQIARLCSVDTGIPNSYFLSKTCLDSWTASQLHHMSFNLLFWFYSGLPSS